MYIFVGNTIINIIVIYIGLVFELVALEYTKYVCIYYLRTLFFQHPPSSVDVKSIVYDCKTLRRKGIVLPAVLFMRKRGIRLKEKVNIIVIL